MHIIEWWRKGRSKPYGIVGLDDNGKLFVKGDLDEEYLLDDLSTNVEDEDGNQLTEKDGVKFLNGVIERYMRNVSEYDGALLIKGPFEVKILPELGKLDSEIV